MWKKVLVVGATSAAIVGAGTAALAVTGSSSPTPSPSAGSAHHTKAHGGSTRALHGTFVTRAGKGSTGFVTHDEIRGTVTAVSSTSISVKAVDGYVQTYAVTAKTIEHLKTDGAAKGAAGRIAMVHVGDRVRVVGTGTATPTATRIADGGTGKASTGTA